MRPFLRQHCSVFRLALATTLCALTFTALPAFAGLGQDVGSVESDRAHMQGALRVTQVQAYAVHEIQSPNGTVVREYVSTSGKVFAVAWQGPWLPDMRQILAGYFESYQSGAQMRQRSRLGLRPMTIQQPGLVVQSGGHMRWFAGRAYVPDMLPQGVKAETLR